MQFLELFIQFNYLDFKLDSNSQGYQMYLNLRRILCFVMRLELTETDLEKLLCNVIRFLEKFITFCNRSVIFKMHFMLHYNIP